MRATWKIALTVGVAVLLAQCVQAQQRGRGRGGFGAFGGPTMLLSNPSVQKELNLSDEQKEKVKELTTKLSEKATKDREALQDLDQAERREKGQQNQKAQAEEANKGIASIFKPEQVTRYNQIRRQQLGVAAFSDAEVQKVLKLTDEQKESLKTIAEDARAEQGELFRGGGAGGGGNREEFAKKMAAFRKEFTDKSVAILTADQKKAWKELVGAPFELKFDPNAAGRGRGRRGGNNNNNNNN